MILPENQKRFKRMTSPETEFSAKYLFIYFEEWKGRKSQKLNPEKQTESRNENVK